MAVDRWRQYLQCQEFVIQTYHRSLYFLTDQQLHSELQKKAMTKLMGLNFKIVYRQGKDNLAADALSRCPAGTSVAALSEVKPLWVQEVLNSYVTDPFASALLQQLSLHSPNEEGYSLDNGIIRKGELIWIGHNSALTTKLILSCKCNRWSFWCSSHLSQTEKGV
jgi:hypothetical protein